MPGLGPRLENADLTANTIFGPAMIGQYRDTPTVGPGGLRLKGLGRPKEAAWVSLPSHLAGRLFTQ